MGEPRPRLSGRKFRHQCFFLGGVKKGDFCHNPKVIFKKTTTVKFPPSSRFPRTRYEKAIIKTAKQQKILLAFIPTWRVYIENVLQKELDFCSVYTEEEPVQICKEGFCSTEKKGH